VSDFEVLPWKKQPVDGEVAKSIRKDVRTFRKERGRGGHRFRFATLKSLWSADAIHVVLNHSDDSAWQYWYNDARQGWSLISWHMTRREAQVAAEMPHPDLTPEPKFLAEGVYVLAGWPRENGEADYTMKVACSTDKTADEILAVFTHLGFVATKSLLAA
jgi:hypothetical protein